MIQSAITTTVTQSKHLITRSFLFHVLWAGILPALVVIFVRVKRLAPLRAGQIWAASVIGAAVLCVGLLTLDFSTFSVTLRGDKR